MSKKTTIYAVNLQVLGRRVVKLSSIEKLFLHSKTVDVLLKILEAEEKGVETYPLNLSNEVGSPYSYISRVLSEFEENAIIESKYKGRVRVVKLTDCGKRIAEKLKELREEMSKDFIARRKLSLLKSFFDEVKSESVNGSKKCFILAPLKVELENLMEKVKEKDKEAYITAKNLYDKILRCVSEFEICLEVSKREK